MVLAQPGLANLNPGEISNVQVGNIQPRLVTITWTTVHPGSSWVFLNFYNPGGLLTGRKVGQNDSVTSHSVVVNGLVPYNPQAGNGDVGQYSYYVGSQRTDDNSWATYGGPHTNSDSDTLTFQTTQLDINKPLSVILNPLGQKNVYAGHDLYVMPTISLRAGGAGAQLGKIMVMTASTVTDSGNNTVPWQVDMLDTMRAYPEGFNPPPGWDGKIYKVGSGQFAGDEYVWGAAEADWSTATQMNGDQGAMRVRVPGAATPGNYVLHTQMQMFTDDGATNPVGPLIFFNWPFKVYPPAQFTATPPNSFPPIPSLSTWQNTMTSTAIGGGEYWCTGIAAVIPVASLEYGNFLGPIFDLVGTFNAYSQPDATKAYNYDGGRVYMQIADYTFNNFGMPGYHDPATKAHWEHCAQMVLYPYDNWITRSLGEFIDEPNQHMFGTGMYYARTSDPTAKSALSFVTDTNGSYTGYYGALDTRDVRWISYSWDSQTANEASGAHTPWVLAGAATDIAMANLDMFQQFAVNQGSSVLPEWNYHNYSLGLLLEALIDQCELDKEKLRGCDPRIPLEVGKTLYALFNNFYLSDIGTTRYDLIDVPMSHAWNDQNSTDVWSNLNNLIAPAAAWYWAQTSDDTIRQYGDSMFASTWDDTSDLTWGAKQFTQVYKWSFDFVRYRSGPNPKATFLPSQNQFEGPWPDTAPPLIFSEYNCGLLNMGSQQGHRWPQLHQIDGNALCQTSTLPNPIVNGTTVTLTWDTIEPATTEVYYTTSPPPVCAYGMGQYDQSITNCLGEYAQHFSADPNGVRHHNAVVNGLAGKTTYHYILYSKDPTGNGAITPDATFTTQ